MDDGPFILSNDEDNNGASGSNSLLSGAQLTSPLANMEALVCRSNVMTMRFLFID